MSLSPTEIQYMKEHIHDNKVPNVIATIAICLSIAYIAVGLRLYARHITGVRLGGDDYWIIAALVRLEHSESAHNLQSSPDHIVD